ncbi:hypothetical protein AVEN_112544-1, partial [Araneus ventricosus]
MQVSAPICQRLDLTARFLRQEWEIRGFRQLSFHGSGRPRGQMKHHPILAWHEKLTPSVSVLQSVTMPFHKAQFKLTHFHLRGEGFTGIPTARFQPPSSWI